MRGTTAAQAEPAYPPFAGAGCTDRLTRIAVPAIGSHMGRRDEDARAKAEANRRGKGVERILAAVAAHRADAPTVSDLARDMDVSNSRARQIVQVALERKAVRIVPRRDGRDGIAARGSR